MADPDLEPSPDAGTAWAGAHWRKSSRSPDGGPSCLEWAALGARLAQSRGLRRLRTELEYTQRQRAGDPTEARSVPARGPGGDHEGGDDEQREPEGEADRGPEPPAHRA